ncbi:MAG TPA: hypothetical protein VM658_20625 [bacterium]|nr:hypothetical protein [bacterium]
MPCKFFRKSTLEIPVLSQSEPVLLKEDICLLKLYSIDKKLEVYQSLFKKGLQGSMFSDDCPVGRNDKWDECDYYEE